MKVNITCGNIKVKALIDTGCSVNVVYKKAFENMVIGEEKMEKKVN